MSKQSETNAGANKLVVLVQRHMILESRLASALESLNEATAKILASSGLRGPTADDVSQLEPKTIEVQESAGRVASARAELIGRASKQTGRKYESIKELLVDLPAQFASQLDGLRNDILWRCEAAQANLINNQAMLHYTFDFHRKYLAGILGTDAENQNYRADGQATDAPKGNFFGRTC